MPACSPEPIVEFLSKIFSDLVEKDPNYEVHRGFVGMCKEFVLDTTPTGV